VQLGGKEAPRPFSRCGESVELFPVFSLKRRSGFESISFEAENTLSAATATGQWAQPDCYGLTSPPRYFSHYFFLGGVAIFVSEGADAATFGFSFFGFLASRSLRT
jgi:hypothetical protein